MKWQVWVGVQLKDWREEAGSSDPNDSRMPLKSVALQVALPADRLSRIESGERRIDAVELRALAEVYGKRPADIAALFTPPTRARWGPIAGRHEYDVRFEDPPGGQPALPFKPKTKKRAQAKAPASGA